MINPSCKPKLLWVQTREIQGGFNTSEIGHLLTIPGHAGYIGQGIQVVRGNILRGRPKFHDSLNIWYLDDPVVESRAKVNDTLHGIPRSVCAHGWGDAFWKGPVVAVLKAGDPFDAPQMKDMNMTAYRDAIDYLQYFLGTIGSMIDEPGSSHNLSKRVMEQRSGKVEAVRIN